MTKHFITELDQIASWIGDPNRAEQVAELGDLLAGMLDDLDRIERRLVALLKILRQNNDQYGTSDRR